MKEFIDKLIERLEELHGTYKKKYRFGIGNLQVLDGCQRGLEDAIEIVNELAEEFATDINVVSNNGWIPCSERLPENIIKDCLVTLENGAVFQASYSDIGKEFRMICWHGIERFSEENKVIAWQPLPEPYKPTAEQPDSTTEAWKQQTMSRFERVE